jgi:glycerol uptake facilitator-like aquaporin
VWLFIVAPLIGGAIAAGLYRYLVVEDPATATSP